MKFIGAKRKIQLVTGILCLVTLCFSVFSRAETDLQQHMIGTTYAVFNVFSQMYAPRDWKKEHLSWDVGEERQKIIDTVSQNPDITIKEFHRLLLSSVNQLHDYHVSLFISSSESATLPFRVKPSYGRYFVVANFGSPSTFPFDLGDELIAMNDRPVDEIVQDFLKKSPAPQSPTEKMLAAFQLTSRRAVLGEEVPRGLVNLVFRRKGETELSYFQTVWDYTPDSLSFSGFNSKPRALARVSSESSLSLISQLDVQMISEKALLFNDGFVSGNEEEEGHRLGAKKSFLPEMGKVISQSPSHNFYNYIFEHKGKKIGYVRIGTYSPPIKRTSKPQNLLGEYTRYALQFQDLINEYEQKTDMLVIDQIHNPGGSLIYLYALASMLSDKPLKTPRHHKTLSGKDIQASSEELAILEGIKSEEDVKQVFPDLKYLAGLPINLNFIKIYKNSLSFDIEQWDLGNHLTDPTYIVVDTLHPHPRGVYTKPIIVLVDELDFSGGDFFPAILQDNKRATIFGTPTSGAGGYINKTLISDNYLLVQKLSYTGSIAKRVDGRPIENLGVTPDVMYALTPEDYQNGYRGYKEALLRAIDQKLGL